LKSDAGGKFGTYGVGGVEGLLGVADSVKAQTITPEQALQILVIIYGLEESEARKILGI